MSADDSRVTDTRSDAVNPRVIVDNQTGKIIALCCGDNCVGVPPGTVNVIPSHPVPSGRSADGTDATFGGGEISKKTPGGIAVCMPGVIRFGVANTDELWKLCERIADVNIWEPVHELERAREQQYGHLFGGVSKLTYYSAWPIVFEVSNVTRLDMSRLAGR